MPVDLELFEKYSPGGDIHRTLSQDYGSAAADRIFEAFKAGGRFAANDALVEVKNGPRLNDSTLSNFGQRLATDPFAAPLASANNVLSTITSSAVFGLVKNPFVLGALILFLIIRFPGLLGRLKALTKK